MTRVVDVVRAVIAPLTRTRIFRRVIGPTLLPPMERLLAWASNGRVQLSALLVPSLVLHTVGARSGEQRDVPLMYTPDGQGRAIVAGTNFAGARHPSWTANLLANPDAEITVRGRRMPVRATQIPDDERDAAWATIERQWPGYRNYERESGRTVRLFRLQPVGDARAARVRSTAPRRSGAIDGIRALLAPVSRTTAFRRFATTVLPSMERFVSYLSRGRIQLTSAIVPSLVLHTVGAKSGEPRDAPLMYTPDGHGRAIVAGTNWAGARHPAWTANLLAHPDAEITVHGRRMPVHATLIPDAERQAVWALMEAQWPDYRQYERDSGRTARIFLLTPVVRSPGAA